MFWVTPALWRNSSSLAVLPTAPLLFPEELLLEVVAPLATAGAATLLPSEPEVPKVAVDSPNVDGAAKGLNPESLIVLFFWSLGRPWYG